MGDILFLAHRVPFPPDRGDKIRAYHLLKHLAGRGRVHLAAFADDGDDQAASSGLAGMLGEYVVLPRRKPIWRAALEALASGQPVSVAAFADPAMQAAVDGLLARHPIDTVFVFSSQMAQYVRASGGRRFVMDFCDVDSAKFAQYGEDGAGPKAWWMRREGRLLLAHDGAVAERADASLFVSPAEAALFAKLTGAPRVHAVANGIDAGFFDPDRPFAPVSERGPLIVFTGQMDYPPNIAAVTWFADDILPLVRSRYPAARFAIVGRAPGRTVRTLGEREGVIVTGAVDDVRGWLAAAAVVVAPLRLARGVQNKVLEAMAMARPVVASAAAAEGIDHGDTIQIGGDAAAIADQVGAMLADPAAAAALGVRARARVIDRYDWAATLTPLDSLLKLPARDAQRDAA